MSQNHNDPPAEYFKIQKIRGLIAQKYYWETLQHDIDIYVKESDVCLAWM